MRRASLVALLAWSSNATTHIDQAQPSLWPVSVSQSTDTVNIDASVGALLSRMTLEEKVGQMIQADIASITPAQLRQYKLGSILAGGGAAPGGDVRAVPQMWINLTEAYREAAFDGDVSHPSIPILFGIDAVHGNAKIVDATVFPHNVGLGAAHDAQLVRRIGEATAQEVAAVGIDWTFAPTVAVTRDVRWGRSYESYSEDPRVVAEYAAAMVSGLQGGVGTPQFMAASHTLASVKHFLGDGGTLAGRDQGDDEAPEATLSRVHAAGYPSAIQAGAMIVMASYNSWRGTKLHASHYLLTDILKERMGFGGFVIGDWNAQEQIPGCTKFDCPTAYLAGVDMLMAPDSWKQLYHNTLAEARSGVIPAARIDDAVRRILRVKMLAGLFDRQRDEARRQAENLTLLGSREHRTLAREAVRKSLVLIKNEHGTLPLRSGMRILVAGSAADNLSAQAGGWTIDWQGDHNSNSDFPGGTSIFAGIKAVAMAGGGSVELQRDGHFARRPDVAIVVFGETPYAEFEGDRETLDYSLLDPKSLQLLRRLHGQRVPVVAIFISGRPMWINPELNAADAFIAAWLPGSEGEGVADLLFRNSEGSTAYDFTGSLSFSWPDRAMPVSFEADSDRVRGALFNRGYGLSYAHPAHLHRTSENPGISADQLNLNLLYQSAHVIAPWSMYLSDSTAEVRLTTARQDSPLHALSVSQNANGSSAQWTGAKPSMLRIAGRQADLAPQAQQGTAIELRYRLDETPTQPVRVGIRCVAPYVAHAVAAAPSEVEPTSKAALCGTNAGAMLDLTRRFTASRVGGWSTVRYSLSCFSAQGASLSDVESPIALETAGRFALTISEVRFVQHKGTERCDGG